MTQRTFDEVIFPNITMKGEFGHAEVQMVTRLIDPATGEQVGSDQYHRHVLTLDDDDASEHLDVQRARSGFEDSAMRGRWEAEKVIRMNESRGLTKGA